MLTTLPKHRGQHGGLIAVGVLVATSAVVYTTQSPPPAPPTTDVSHKISSSAQRPAASVSRTPERVAPTVTPIVDPTTSRGAGYVAYDEARTSHVTVPVAGWLETKRTASVGRAVRQFEPLATVYSVDVYLATTELVEQLGHFTSQDALNAARFKLLRWGMPKPTLDRIEATRRPSAALPLVTRVPGVVVAAQATPGLVEPSELFTVTDPTRTMVFVEVPEADAVAVGMPAKLTVEGVAKPVNAKVSYVFRRAEEGMRTVRFDVHAKLKPGAKVEAAITLKRWGTDAAAARLHETLSKDIR